VQRVLQEVGAVELAAFQVDGHIENVGNDMHRLRGLRRAGVRRAGIHGCGCRTAQW
jgi:hypothetical protein